MAKHTVAFTFGGLAGVNAHGAGFLHAAQERGVVPSVISCTSGMIAWVAHYLAGEDLSALMDQSIQMQPKLQGPYHSLMQLAMMTSGVPGVFRPAYPEIIARWMTSALPTDFNGWANRLLPTQTMVPTRSPAYFQFMANQFNRSDVGILFNSYSPQDAVEYVYLNDAARAKLALPEGDGKQNSVVYRAITPQAVEAALWLSAYGFDKRFDGQHQIDGAYHRQFILNELCYFHPELHPERIYAVRPQNSRWIGQMPANQFEQMDFFTEMFMNSTYRAQLSQIRLINRQISKGQLRNSDYRHVEIEELEIDVQEGFFNYFVERREVFDHAYGRSMALLESPTLARAA